MIQASDARFLSGSSRFCEGKGAQPRKAERRHSREKLEEFKEVVRMREGSLKEKLQELTQVVRLKEEQEEEDKKMMIELKQAPCTLPLYRSSTGTTACSSSKASESCDTSNSTLMNSSSCLSVSLQVRELQHDISGHGPHQVRRSEPLPRHVEEEDQSCAGRSYHTTRTAPRRSAGRYAIDRRGSLGSGTNGSLIPVEDDLRSCHTTQTGRNHHYPASRRRTHFQDDRKNLYSRSYHPAPLPAPSVYHHHHHHYPHEPRPIYDPYYGPTPKFSNRSTRMEQERYDMCRGYDVPPPPPPHYYDRHAYEPSRSYYEDDYDRMGYYDRGYHDHYHPPSYPYSAHIDCPYPPREDRYYEEPAHDYERPLRHRNLPSPPPPVTPTLTPTVDHLGGRLSNHSRSSRHSLPHNSNYGEEDHYKRYPYTPGTARPGAYSMPPYDQEKDEGARRYWSKCQAPKCPSRNYRDQDDLSQPCESINGGHSTTTSKSRVSSNNDNAPTTTVVAAPVVGPDDDVYIEIGAGVKTRLRRTKETMVAIANDFYVPASCMGCSSDLFCIADCQYIFCPSCQSISPLKACETNNFIGKDGSKIVERNGVGLGFTYDTLFEMQAEMVANAEGEEAKKNTNGPNSS